MKAEDDGRYLVLWLESPEANAIAAPLMGSESLRPTSHDLLKNIISDMEGRLTHVVLNDLSNDVMRSRIVIEIPGRSLDFDSRPSDAIALALRNQVSIFAEEELLNKAGIFFEDTDVPNERPAAPREHRGEPLSPVNPLELEGMSAFKDFIQSLNLDDLDKPQMPPV